MVGTEGVDFVSLLPFGGGSYEGYQTLGDLGDRIVLVLRWDFGSTVVERTTKGEAGSVKRFILLLG